MRMRSMITPLRPRGRSPGGLFAAVPGLNTRADCGESRERLSLSTFRLLRSCFSRREFTLARFRWLGLVLGAAARLRLAALEVFPQRRTQPRLPRRLRPGLRSLGHGRNLGSDLRPVHALWFAPAVR